MPYTPPDKATFVAIYPLFASVSDPAYDHWSAEAARRIAPFEDCLGDGLNSAGMLAIAHLLTKAGIGSGTDAQMAAQGATGFKSIKSGSLSLDRFDSDVSTEGGDWGTTSYGKELWGMIRPCVAGPLVSSTGTLPCIGPFGRYW
ncbi:DUF4054 domain-containing protein [uncultured Novosphingobium sp.]|uniref:DUF4054 domain-containing protein n=1 Tax=uncultured Novosphingobium sp. TaxID=292277 RepID=UPI002591FA21|nr:DUF4054 domain-containing protein [uncultured Novosphingobium sp.]